MKTYLIIVFFAAILFAQIEDQKDFSEQKVRYGFEIFRKPPVNFKVFVNYTKEGWQPRVYFALAIQNDFLQFEKVDEQYHAQYQTTIVVRGDDAALHKQTWRNDVYLEKFDDTNSRGKFQYFSYQVSDFVQPEDSAFFGELAFYLEMRDMVSKNSYKRKRTFTLNPNNLSHTEITFLTHFSDSLNPDRSLPLIPSETVLNLNQPGAAYARLKTESMDSVDINARIYKEKDDAFSLYYQSFFSFKSDSGVCDIWFDLPADTLDEGKYRLRFSNENFNLEKEFRIIWFEKPTYLYKKDLALRPMRYILSEATYDSVKDLSRRKFEQWFDAFWRKRDQTPKTIYNEVMNEFFQRVGEANRRFSSRYREGWESDRGRIFILYGEPSKVENRRYSTSNHPHLIWIYENLNLSFIFVDSDKDGDFDLLEKKEKE